MLKKEKKKSRFFKLKNMNHICEFLNHLFYFYIFELLTLTTNSVY